MKQKLLTIGALLLLSLVLTTVQAQTTMNVKSKNGTSTAYVISDTRKITFSGSNFVMTKKDASSTSYAISDSRYMNFTPGISTVVNDAKQATNKLTVYPNPVQDRLTISMVTGTSERIKIDVFGIDGKVVYSQTISAQQSKNHSINVSEWQGGMYLVRIITGNEIMTNKFMKN